MFAQLLTHRSKSPVTYKETHEISWCVVTMSSAHSEGSLHVDTLVGQHMGFGLQNRNRKSCNRTLLYRLVE